MAIIPSSRGTMFYDPQHRLYQTSNQSNMNDTDQIYTMQDIKDTVAEVSSNSTVIVSSNGTSDENGVALLAAYDEAKAKITTAENIQAYTTYPFESWMNQGNGIYQFLFTPNPGLGDTPLNVPYEWTADFGDGVKTYTIIVTQRLSNQNFKFRVSLNGVYQTSLTFPNINTQGFPVREVLTNVTTLIIGPGTYNIASDLELDGLVNVVGIAKQEEIVKITGNGVHVKSGANNSIYPIVVGGFTTDGIWMESNLPYITYREIRSTQAGSFQMKNYGAGSVDGTFIRCVSSFESFGSGDEDTVPTGVSADGTFVECQARSSFGCKQADSSGLYIRCNNPGSYIGNTDDSRFHQLSYTFGYYADIFNGYLIDCGGDYQVFGALANDIGANFINCTGGQRAFAYKAVTNDGQYVNCTATSSYGFSGVAKGDHSGALYVNCTALQPSGAFAFGAPDQYGMSTPCEATFINCTSTGAYPFGGGPSYYSLKECHANVLNCFAIGQTNGDFPAVAGNGKIRNSIDPTYTVVNYG